MFCALALQLLCTPLTPWLDAVSLESSFLKLTQKRQAHNKNSSDPTNVATMRPLFLARGDDDARSSPYTTP